MDKKTCRECEQEKPVDEFYAHRMMADGRLNKCKECVKSRIKNHRSENIQRIRAYDRKRYLEQEGRKENAMECSRRAFADGRHKEYQRRSNERYPERRAARVTLGNAVRDGKIAKGQCAVCGSEKVHAHHHDYSKPLDVVWLCPTHHGETWRGPRA